MTIEPTPRSPAQQRVIDAAMARFAELGVSGTSLQDIADALGVTKAAVYHQFRTKEEIVLAAAETPLRELGVVADRAEAMDSPTARLEVLIDGFTDLVVRHRHTIGPLQGDAAMGQVIKSHPPYAQVIDRLLDLVAGAGASGDGARVRAVMMVNAIIATGASPVLADLSAADLRRHLREGGRRLVGP